MSTWKASSREVQEGEGSQGLISIGSIHCDLMGPFLHPSISKVRYVLTFLDDYSRCTWVFFLRKNLEVFENLKEFKELVETQLRRKIESLYTNNGGKYVNIYVHNICLEDGI
jgi:hypothetical protein